MLFLHRVQASRLARATPRTNNSIHSDPQFLFPTIFCGEKLFTNTIFETRMPVKDSAVLAQWKESTHEVKFAYNWNN